MNILNTVIPIFAIIGFGYILKHFSVVHTNWIKILNQFTYFVSLPALVIGSFWYITWSESTIKFLLFHTLIIILGTFVFLTVAYFLKIQPKTAVTLAMLSLVGNTVYMGFPILNNIIKKEELPVAIGAAAIQLTIGLIISVVVIEHIVLKSKKIKSYLKDLLKNPLIISLILGLSLSFLPENFIPQSAKQTISMLGATASPIALFTLGAFMQGKLNKEEIKLTAISTTIKLLLFPFIIFLICKLLNFNSVYLNTSVLISAMPSAVSAFVISEKYELDNKLSANVIVLSTLLSALTIPILLNFKF